MSNLNKALLMGNLTRDPELRYTPKGTAVADLGIAVNRRVKDGDNWTDETTFVDVTVWGKTAENVQKYLTKGRGVFIEGRLQLDQWEDKETGKKRSKLKVVAENVQFLPDGKSKAEGGPTSRPPSITDNGRPATTQQAVDDKWAAEDDERDSIPF